MKKILLCLGLLGAILVPCLLAAPAHAQATRTWVSGVGDDANPCSRTAPCKTFAGAISKTALGGEINCLDPGGFGGVTITKSITIACEAGTAGVLVAGTNGITVNAGATGLVTLQGLDIEGVGTGLVGVNILSAKQVNITNCTIRNFRSGTAAGVATSGAVNIVAFVSNSVFTNNGTGIKLASSGGFKVANVNRSMISGSTGNGVELTNTSTFASVVESYLQFNGTNGVAVLAATTLAFVDRSTVTNNSTSAFNASASGAIIDVSANNIEGNTAAFVIAGGATINSSADNKVAAGQGATVPNGVLAKQ